MSYMSNKFLDDALLREETSLLFVAFPLRRFQICQTVTGLRNSHDVTVKQTKIRIKCKSVCQRIVSSSHVQKAWY